MMEENGKLAELARNTAIRIGKRLAVRHLNEKFERLFRQLAEQRAAELNQRLLSRFIGSTITDLRIQKIKGRKTMYRLEILTDAEPVTETLPSGNQVVHDVGKLVVNVKIRR